MTAAGPGKRMARRAGIAPTQPVCQRQCPGSPWRINEAGMTKFPHVSVKTEGYLSNKAEEAAAAAMLRRKSFRHPVPVKQDPITFDAGTRALRMTPSPG